MEWFSPVEWESIFIPDTPLLEIMVRGTIMYIALFILLRLIRRQAGSVGMTDVLVIVLMADAAQNAMADDYKSLPDGILLVATIVFWNYAFEWMGFHFPLFEKVINSPPMVLIKNGRMQRKNMKKELITEEDLMTQLRQQGVEHIHQVKKACLEGDGKISVIKKEDTDSSSRTAADAKAH